jgi:hypothetical protein
MDINELLDIVPVKEPYHQRSRWSASSLGKCKRMQLLSAHGIRLKEAPDRQRVFAMCSSIHVEAQKWIKSAYENAEIELPVSDQELLIGGRIDVLIID